MNKFAECISLPDHVTVKVRAVTNLPKATLVTVEPHSEDDWEILELNSEHAEAAILKQVLCKDLSSATGRSLVPVSFY